MSIKRVPNKCPQCEGPALEFPLETIYEPTAPSYYEEVLRCADCGHIWSEYYHKEYLGYKNEDKDYDNMGKLIDN